MKSSRLIVLGLLGLFLAVGLAGCIIVSASPNPMFLLDMKIGDSQTFKVDGPQEEATLYRYWWFVDGEYIFDSGKQYTFVADPQTHYISNQITIECQLYQYRLGLVSSGGQSGTPPHLGWDWFFTDRKVWNIRIVQDPPVWQGNYRIEDDTDLQLLKDFTTITGDLLIDDSYLTSLAGLENLTSVGGSLDIWGNYTLKNLSGLENLASVGGLQIGNNVALTSLTGLDNLTSIDGDLDIECNNTLKNLSGLENLISVGGDLDIYGCGTSALTSLNGLENVASVGGDLSIENNPALTSLSSLENLTSLSGSLLIKSNSTLMSLSGMEKLTSVGGDLSIGGVFDGNPALTSLSGLENITSVSGNLYVTGNMHLTSLSGLGNLTSIGGDLSIGSEYDDNAALTSLSGLENLTSVGGDLIISYNAVLTSLSALNKIKTVGSLNINNNSSLVSLGLSDLSKVTYQNPYFGYAFNISANPALCSSLAYELLDQVLAREGIGGTQNIEGNKTCTTP